MSVSKQDLYDAYARHNADPDLADHEPGSDPNCAICTEINRITALLEGKTFSDDNYRRSRTRYTPKIFFVETKTGEQLLYRVTTQRQEQTLLRDNEYHQLDQRDQDGFYLNSDNNALVSLGDFLRSNPKIKGLIATLQKMTLNKGEAVRKAHQPDRYIKYTGDNKNQVAHFVHPGSAKPTKKEDKLQIESLQGSFSIAPSDFLVKLKTGYLLRLSQDDFCALYTTIDQDEWVLATPHY
jgi:hypothetical protein